MYVFPFSSLVPPVETQKVKQLHKGKSTSTCAEEIDPSTICNKIDPVGYQKVPHSGESLECGSLELQTSANDAHVPNPCVDNNQANLNEPTDNKQSDVQHPSLMKPNSTSRTHEVTMLVVFFLLSFQRRPLVFHLVQPLLQFCGTHFYLDISLN